MLNLKMQVETNLNLENWLQTKINAAIKDGQILTENDMWKADNSISEAVILDKALGHQDDYETPALQNLVEETLDSLWALTVEDLIN